MIPCRTIIIIIVVITITCYNIIIIITKKIATRSESPSSKIIAFDHSHQSKLIFFQWVAMCRQEGEGGSVTSTVCNYGYIYHPSSPLSSPQKNSKQEDFSKEQA